MKLLIFQDYLRFIKDTDFLRHIRNPYTHKSYWTFFYAFIHHLAQWQSTWKMQFFGYFKSSTSLSLPCLAKKSEWQDIIWWISGRWLFFNKCFMSQFKFLLLKTHAFLMFQPKERIERVDSSTLMVIYQKVRRVFNKLDDYSNVQWTSSYQKQFSVRRSGLYHERVKRI